MSGEAVKVVVRCRPLFGKEIVEKRESIVRVDVASAQVAIFNPAREGDAPKTFTFDATYDENTIRETYTRLHSPRRIPIINLSCV